MILVDTSVWIDHFRVGNPLLNEVLGSALVVTHPYVIDELAGCNLENRVRILADLNALPLAVSATHQEVLQLIEEPSFGDAASAGSTGTFSLPPCFPTAGFGGWTAGLAEWRAVREPSSIETLETLPQLWRGT